MILLEMLNIFFVMIVLYWIVTVFIEFMFYTETFVKDIKQIFEKMNLSVRSSKDIESLVDHCKEIVVLMCRINR